MHSNDFSAAYASEDDWLNYALKWEKEKKDVKKMWYIWGDFSILARLDLFGSTPLCPSGPCLTRRSTVNRSYLLTTRTWSPCLSPTLFLSSSLSLSRSPSFNIPLPSGPALSYLTPAHPALWFELLSQPQIICTLHTLCFSHILSCLWGYVSQTDIKWTVTHAFHLILDTIHRAFR